MSDLRLFQYTKIRFSILRQTFMFSKSASVPDPPGECKVVVLRCSPTACGEHYWGCECCSKPNTWI